MEDARLVRARIRLRLALRLLAAGFAVAVAGLALFRAAPEAGGLLALAGVALVHTSLALAVTVAGNRGLPVRPRAVALAGSAVLAAAWWAALLALREAARGLA